MNLGRHFVQVKPLSSSTGKVNDTIQKNLISFPRPD